MGLTLGLGRRRRLGLTSAANQRNEDDERERDYAVPHVRAIAFASTKCRNRAVTS
jgi:hypothetical protein